MQRTQYQIRLFSRQAYDSLGRILDLSRKMELELSELRVVNRRGTAEITMSLLPLGRHSGDALLCRLWRVVGVTRICIDDLGDISKQRQSNTRGPLQGRSAISGSQ
jgi:hypothetical protein